MGPVERPPEERVVVAIDVADESKAKSLILSAAMAGAIIKIGLEVLSLGGAELIKRLFSDLPSGMSPSKVILDLKLGGDIANTLKACLKLLIETGVDVRFVTVHDCVAPVRAALDAIGATRVGVLRVTILTDVRPGAYSGGQRKLTADVVRLALDAKADGASGIVCSPFEAGAVRAAVGDEIFEIMTPSVRPAWSEPVTGDDQARAMDITAAMMSGATLLVIGRPITRAADAHLAMMRCANDIEGGRRLRADVVDALPKGTRYIWLSRDRGPCVTVERAREVFRAAAHLREAHYVLKSGRHSPHFVNGPKAFMRGSIRSAVAQAMLNDCGNVSEFSGAELFFVGVADEGLAVAQALADENQRLRPWVESIYVPSKKLGDGFEIPRGLGVEIAGKPVIVIEGTITRGESLGTAVTMVRELGAQVVGVMCVTRRGTQATADVVRAPWLYALDHMAFEEYPEDDCPLCRSGVPITPKPGYGAKFLEQHGGRQPPYNNA